MFVLGLLGLVFSPWHDMVLNFWKILKQGWQVNLNFFLLSFLGLTGLWLIKTFTMLGWNSLLLPFHVPWVTCCLQWHLSWQFFAGTIINTLITLYLFSSLLYHEWLTDVLVWWACTKNIQDGDSGHKES